MRLGGIDLVVLPDAEAAAPRLPPSALGRCDRGRARSCSPAGSTPRRAYELAADAHADWGGAEIWFGDDRCVPPSDPRSNQRLVREALLERVLVPPLVHPVETRLPPEEAAAAYEAELRGQILDLVLLGLGPDGHTASLFPRAASLDETARLAVAVEAALEPFVERVTMTIPALASAAHVVFLAVGGEKAEAVRGAFAEEPSSRRAREPRAVGRRSDDGDPRRGCRARSFPDAGTAQRWRPLAGRPQPPVAPDQLVRRAIVPERGLPVRLELGHDPLREHLAELDAPLVEGVDRPRRPPA